LKEKSNILFDMVYSYKIRMMLSNQPTIDPTKEARKNKDISD